MNTATRQRVFLSASVPLPSRDRSYFETADVIAIRDAIRALTIVVIEQELQLVFGGHPAITPMIRLQIAQAGISVGDRFVVFQSRYFERDFSTDNSAFEHIELIDSVSDDHEASLLKMRREMLTGPFQVGLFVGGMEGVEEEYAMFLRLQPDVPAFPIASTGAAAAKIFDSRLKLRKQHPELRDELSYLTLMRDLLAGAPSD
jgi:hypothetical protein